jgi:hypothetical protein
VFVRSLPQRCDERLDALAMTQLAFPVLVESSSIAIPF